MLPCWSRRIIGRGLDQFMQLFGSMRATDFNPIGDIVAILYLGPMGLEIETAHTLGDTERQLAGGICMCISGHIIIIEDDDISAL